VQAEREIARILLKLGAVAINVEEPFVYTSGTRSPIYCDNRLLISHPPERSAIVSALVERIEAGAGAKAVDVVAGTATAGIPWAAWVADRLGKPMIYVRAQAKEHGRGRQIEGRIDAGQRVVVVEDLVSTGGSSISTIRAIRDAGGQAERCVAIFTYGLPRSAAAYRDAGVELATLSSIAVLLDVAIADGHLAPADRGAVERWLRDQSAES
jgi:orotate phosphoribosyltransferase